MISLKNNSLHLVRVCLPISKAMRAHSVWGLDNSWTRLLNRGSRRCLSEWCSSNYLRWGNSPDTVTLLSIKHTSRTIIEWWWSGPLLVTNNCRSSPRGLSTFTMPSASDISPTSNVISVSGVSSRFSAHQDCHNSRLLFQIAFEHIIQTVPSGWHVHYELVRQKLSQSVFRGWNCSRFSAPMKEGCQLFAPARPSKRLARGTCGPPLAS